LFQPLDGNSSENVSLLAALQAIAEQVRTTDEEPSVCVADNGVSSEATMHVFHQAHVKWVSGVSETSTEAKRVLAQSDETWQASEDGSIHWVSQTMNVPQGKERWLIVYTSASQLRAQATMQRQVTRAQAEWEKQCRHLGARRFAWKTDAQTAMEREKKGQPGWLDIHHELVAHARHGSPRRPRKQDSSLKREWQIVATVTITQQRVEHEAFRKAWWMVGTTMRGNDALSDEA
jgi:transposase